MQSIQMNHHEIILGLVNTSVDVGELFAYLISPSTYFQQGEKAGLNGFTCQCLAFTDSFEHKLRLHLYGNFPTLDLALWSIKEFIDYSPELAPGYIKASLDQVEGKLLSSEWFEYLPLLRAVRNQIAQEFGI